MVCCILGCLFYVSKYMSKVVDLFADNWGRWWGVHNSEFLPVGETISFPLPPSVAYDFLRLMRRFARLKSRAYKSLTIICNASFWVSSMLW